MLWLIQDQTDMHKLSPPWEGPFVVSKNLNNDPITSLIYENALSHAILRRRPIGHGTLFIFGLTTLEPPALTIVHTFIDVYIFL